MYIQIIEKCNFSCSHCCWDCKSSGQNMSLSTFKMAVALSNELGNYITLGGGEPTLHPKMWEFIGYALSQCVEDVGLFIVTNGSQTDTAIGLARMAQRGIMGAALSRTRFHDEIDPQVVKAFTRPDRRGEGHFYQDGRSNDLREIRGDGKKWPYTPIRVGRAKRLQDTREGCACEEWFVTPTGRIHFCGCPGAPVVGSARTGIGNKWLEYRNIDLTCYKQLSGCSGYKGSKEKHHEEARSIWTS